MKTIKNLSDFVSKSSIKPELSGVLITPNKMVATDSYRLIEIITPTTVINSVIAMLPKGLKSFDEVVETDGKIEIVKGSARFSAQTLDGGSYPKYEELISDKALGEPVATLKVNASYLKQMAQAFEKADKFDAVTINIYGNYKPIMFSAPGMRAALMPLNF